MSPPLGSRVLPRLPFMLQQGCRTSGQISRPRSKNRRPMAAGSAKLMLCELRRERCLFHRDAASKRSRCPGSWPTGLADAGRPTRLPAVRRRSPRPELDTLHGTLCTAHARAPEAMTDSIAIDIGAERRVEDRSVRVLTLALLPFLRWQPPLVGRQTARLDWQALQTPRRARAAHPPSPQACFETLSFFPPLRAPCPHFPPCRPPPRLTPSLSHSFSRPCTWLHSASQLADTVAC